MICTGILFMPRSFMLGGWLFSSLCFLFIGSIYFLTIFWLGKAHDRHGGTFSQLGELSMGRIGYYLVEGSIFLTQLGYFVTDSVFFVSNLQNILGSFGLHLTIWHCGIIEIALVCPLVVIKEIRNLTIVILIGLLIVCLLYTSDAADE